MQSAVIYVAGLFLTLFKAEQDDHGSYDAKDRQHLWKRAGPDRIAPHKRRQRLIHGKPGGVAIDQANAQKY